MFISFWLHRMFRFIKSDLCVCVCVCVCVCACACACVRALVQLRVSYPLYRKHHLLSSVVCTFVFKNLRFSSSRLTIVYFEDSSASEQLKEVESALQSSAQRYVIPYNLKYTACSHS